MFLCANADRRSCSRAKTAGNFKAGYKRRLGDERFFGQRQRIFEFRKVYIGGRDSVRVPARKIHLENGEPPVYVYDTSGPQGHDVREGLPPLRRPWIDSRGGVQEVPPSHAPVNPAAPEIPRGLKRETVLRGNDNVTQMHYARRGAITEEMEFIAIRETSNPNSFGLKWLGAEPSFRQTSTTQRANR